MKTFISILLMIIMCTACQFDLRKEDASSANVEIKVSRYDHLQYEATVLNSVSALQKMNLDFPRATKLLIEDVLVIGNVNDAEINERLCAYYSDTVLVRLMEDALAKYEDMSFIEKGLTNGFKALKKEIPDIPVPKVYSQISALNQSVVVEDSLLGFSIDKYMGADYPLYRRYYYDSQLRSMTPDRILPDCFTYYLFSLYPFHWETGFRTLFDIILYRGKINWVVRRILDIESNEELIGYTEEEREWCKKNKEKLWDWMKMRGHLTSTDPMVIRAYTHPDPNVLFKGEKVPPPIGLCLGTELIGEYIKKHPETSMIELLEQQDFRELLER